MSEEVISGTRGTTHKGNVNQDGTTEMAKVQNAMDGEGKDKQVNDNINHTPFTLNKNNNNEHDKEKEVIPNRNVNVGEYGDNGGSQEDGHDDARKPKYNSDTKCIFQNPYESSVTTDKNTNEIYQNTHWLIMATVIFAACTFTALHIPAQSNQFCRRR